MTPALLFSYNLMNSAGIWLTPIFYSADRYCNYFFKASRRIHM